MATYEINPNNAGTIQIALAGITPLVEYACQITAILLEPTQNTTTTPGTYCGAPVDTPGLSSWAIVISFLQDWGNTPSLSEFTFTNDGALCDYEFTSSNPADVPSMSGSAYVTATAFGGDPGASWNVTTQRWPCNAKPTLTPAVAVFAGMTRDQLLAEADARGVDVPSSATKADIAAALGGAPADTVNA